MSGGIEMTAVGGVGSRKGSRAGSAASGSVRKHKTTLIKGDKESSQDSFLSERNDDNALNID